MVGWGISTFDALYGLQSLSQTFNAKFGNGISNIGRVSNARMDALIGAVMAEDNPAKRTDLLREALRLERSQMLHIPLYEQMIPWAMRKNVTVIHRPDNRLMLDAVTVR